MLVFNVIEMLSWVCFIVWSFIFLICFGKVVISKFDGFESNLSIFILNVIIWLVLFLSIECIMILLLIVRVFLMVIYFVDVGIWKSKYLLISMFM